MKLLGLLSLFLLTAAPVHAQAQRDCVVGTYALEDGSHVDIAPGDEDGLRWRRKDGTTGALAPADDGRWTSSLGWTGRPDGKSIAFSACPGGEIDFDGLDGRRIPFDVRETRFDVQGATLAGRLVLPPGRDPVPLVVLVHGSERTSARDFYALQRLFPSEGIGAFVYDKRGTGASTGDYTQDYLTLAVDAIAALQEARRLAGDRVASVGFQAGSQGGWVAPLAAKIEPVDFLIIGFGLAVSPLDEDREAIAYDMTRHGFGPEVVAKAMEVADASAAIIASNFQDGYERFQAVRDLYSGEPWFRHLRGNITFILLERSPEWLREEGPKLLPSIPFHYDPMPVLRRLDVPQLWILGEDDIDAPIGETVRRLRTLSRAGRPIVTAVFPGAEHGLYQYEVRADGTRVSTRAPEGYFAMMRDFIFNRRLEGEYGARIIGESGTEPGSGAVRQEEARP
jgi:pimeloyl-ACP methyl ester carboxylesterase